MVRSVLCAAADGGVFAVAGAVIPEEFHRVTELDGIRRLRPVAKREKGTGREGKGGERGVLLLLRCCLAAAVLRLLLRYL